MSNQADDIKPVHAHYDVSADHYHVQYERARLSDITQPYPANYFRLQQLLNTFASKNIKRVIEVGVGEGTPLATLGRAGVDRPRRVPLRDRSGAGPPVRQLLSIQHPALRRLLLNSLPGWTARRRRNGRSDECEIGIWRRT